MKIEPSELDEGFVFVDEIVGGSVPKEFIGAVAKGVEEQMNNGVLAGFPILDVKATLFDGSYHDVDSSEIAFQIAGSMAFRDGALNANPVILEPMMKVEVTTPEDWMGDVVGDVNRRRGMIEGMDDGPRILRFFVLKYLFLKCSVTQLIYDQQPKAARLIQWNLANMLKYQRMLLIV